MFSLPHEFLGDRTPANIERGRVNGFKIVDDADDDDEVDMVQDVVMGCPLFQRKE